jgi:carboxyl-terminal processing protease
MIKNTYKALLYGLIFFSIAGAFFSTGLLVGLQLRFSPGFGLNRSQPADNRLGELAEPFYQSWNIIHEQFLNQPVDDTALIRGAIRGMMDSLNDPYSAYMDPEEYRVQNMPLQGEYTGIGAWVDTTGEFLVIMSPMPNSPAENAGLLPGDIVVKIDDEDMVGLDPVLVLNRILGPAGTMVNITITRDQEPEPLQFEIERAVIQVPSVESRLLDNKIGYIRLFTFGENSADEFKENLTSLQDQGAEGIILDLRNNTGGFVHIAVEITSLFMRDKTVLIEEWADGSQDIYRTKGQAIADEIPLVILVNGGSASASEITAGALQDYGRASLVGSQTFGKGYIQNWIPLSGQNGAVRITIARWLTPNGRQIQDFGLTPDVVVEVEEPFTLAESDSQLEKALEKITSEMP